MKINEEYFKLKALLDDYADNNIPININSLKNTAKALNKQPLGKNGLFNGRYISEVNWHMEYNAASKNICIYISFYYYNTVNGVHTEVGTISINKAKYIDNDLILIEDIYHHAMMNAYEEDI